jgi:predicted N-acetyltransferase YhbS
MARALATARARGHRAVLLLGDAPYYGRFGFSATKTGALALPGGFEPERLLALELEDGALDGAWGMIVPTGANADTTKSARSRKAARLVPQAA